MNIISYFIKEAQKKGHPDSEIQNFLKLKEVQEYFESCEKLDEKLKETKKK